MRMSTLSGSAGSGPTLSTRLGQPPIAATFQLLLTAEECSEGGSIGDVGTSQDFAGSELRRFRREVKHIEINY